MSLRDGTDNWGGGFAVAGFVVVASLAAIAIGIVFLVLGHDRRHRRPLGDNEYTIDRRRGTWYPTAGWIALVLGLLGLAWIGVI